MKLSVVMPIFNEEKTIREVLKRLLEVKLSCDVEVILIDDGSTDKTKDYLLQIKTKGKIPLKIIKHEVNKGKGEAVQTGIKAAKGDYLIIQDADLEYDSEEIKNLLQPIFKTKISNKTSIAVYGSRFMGKRPMISPVYYLGNIFLTYLTNLLFGTHLTDMETGFKLLPLPFLKKITLNASRFDFEPEITARLIKAKIPIVEVPISYKGRSHLAGKKLTIADAFAAMKTIFFYRFFND
ncbi:glycosyltransferase family 2 protein [Candidatus Gottesmanbacteria bacterium]|nr:glycosyltransferase family 2 protein [Candidatus Gottesmanbacteria bacterium]